MGFAARSMIKDSSSITVNHELLNTMAIANTGSRNRTRLLLKSALHAVGDSDFVACDIHLFSDVFGNHRACRIAHSRRSLAALSAAVPISRYPKSFFIYEDTL